MMSMTVEGLIADTQCNATTLSGKPSILNAPAPAGLLPPMIIDTEGVTPEGLKTRRVPDALETEQAQVELGAGISRTSASPWPTTGRGRSGIHDPSQVVGEDAQRLDPHS